MNNALLASLVAVTLASGCTKRQPESAQLDPTLSGSAALTSAAPTPGASDERYPATATEDEKMIPGPDQGSGEKVVNLFIWASYTAKSSLEDFTKKTGIRVVESNYASNEELLAKLQSGGSGYDVIVPSDYMVTVLVKLGLLEPLNHEKLSNFKNLEPRFLGQAFDPQNAVSVPYAWTLTGLAVNTAAYKEPVTSWGDLLQNPKAQRRTSLLDDSREAMASALKFQGASLNSNDPAEIDKAKGALIAAKQQLKAFNSNPIEAISSGDVWIAHMYATEALQAVRNSGGKVSFVFPKEGGTLSIDNLAIPKSAPHKEWAMMLIDHLLTAEANAEFVTEVLAGAVVKDVKGKIPADLTANAALFPPPEVLERSELMRDLGEATRLYDRAWSEVKASPY